MSWISWVLFESPIALGLLLLFVNFYLLARWRRGGTARPLLIGLATTVLLFIAQALVTTQREHAIALLHEVEQDVLASRTERLARVLAPTFAAGGMDRDDFLHFVEGQFRRVNVHSADNLELTIRESTGDRFVVSAFYFADLTVGEFTSNLRSRWAFTFVRTPDGWRIEGIEPESIDGVPQATWERIDQR